MFFCFGLLSIVYNKINKINVFIVDHGKNTWNDFDVALKKMSIKETSQNSGAKEKLVNGIRYFCERALLSLTCS
mgnify:CR=1 FL=1